MIAFDGLRGTDENRPLALFAADGRQARPDPTGLGPEAEDGQEDLVLSPAPGAGGVDMEGEHSSQSFANFSIT